MSKAPEVCLYCKGTGEGPGSPCGFCENGVPLDTQEDWDKGWGKLFDMFFKPGKDYKCPCNFPEICQSCKGKKK